MARYIVRRLLWVLVLLFVVTLVTFVIFYLFPSADPATLRAGRQPNPQLVEQIRHNLGLDRPWYVQYGRYMKALVLHFDLGRSYHYNVPVRKQIFDAVGPTASLALGAAVVWLVSGIAVGTISAVRRGRLVDRLSMGVALVAISAPVFWLGLVALYFFDDHVGKIHLLPAYDGYTAITTDPARWFTSLLLPWLVLAASFAAFYARLLRSNLIDTMSQDYIRTARAKGLSERAVIWRHAVRAAITPIVTVLGLDIGILLGGSILTETVFNIPGIGRYAYEGIINSDLPVIQGTVLLGAFFIVVANLLVDIAYAWLDPRVRYS